MIQTPDPRLQGLPVYRRPLRRARGAILWTAALATFVVAALDLVLSMATPAPSVAGTVPAGFDLTSDAEPAPGMGAATTTTPASEAVAERPAASIADVGPVLHGIRPRRPFQERDSPYLPALRPE